MNKIILSTLSIFLIPLSSLAYTSVLTPLGSKYNPINVTITEDPIQKASRESKEAMDALNQTMNRSVVNIPACASTYKAIQDYKSEIYRMGTSNPSTANTARTYLEYLYGRHNSCVSNSITQQPVVPIQPTKTTSTFNPPASDVAKANDQVCQISYGKESYWNGSTCIYCQNGSVLTADKKCTVPTPTKTNDQVCQDNYGVNSKWEGTTNSSGGPMCGCKTGYVWNIGDTLCILPPTLSSGGSGGGGGNAVVTPKVNPIQKIEKQETVKKDIPEKKKVEVVKTETKSTSTVDPYGENWQTKFVHWVINLFR